MIPVARRAVARPATDPQIAAAVARIPQFPQPHLNDEPLTDDEWIFARALDHYKRSRRRPFPSCREVLAVLTALNYRKVADHDDTLLESDAN